MRAYIDTNVYDYVALRHPKYGRVCKDVLSDVYEGTLQAYGSILVAVEILGSLAEINAPPPPRPYHLHRYCRAKAEEDVPHVRGTKNAWRPLQFGLDAEQSYQRRVGAISLA